MPAVIQIPNVSCIKKIENFVESSRLFFCELRVLESSTARATGFRNSRGVSVSDSPG